MLPDASGDDSVRFASISPDPGLGAEELDGVWKSCRNCFYYDHDLFKKDGYVRPLCPHWAFDLDAPAACGGFEDGSRRIFPPGVPATMHKRLSGLIARYAGHKDVWSAIPEEALASLHGSGYREASRSFVAYLCRRLDLPSSLIKVVIGAGASSSIRLGHHLNIISLSPDFAAARDLLPSVLGHQVAHALNYRLFGISMRMTDRHVENQIADATGVLLGLVDRRGMAVYCGGARNDSASGRTGYRPLGSISPEIIGYVLGRREAMAAGENGEEILASLGAAADGPDFSRFMQGMATARQETGRRRSINENGAVRTIY